MLDQLSDWLFDSSGLTAHGFCLLWEPILIWTYAVADCAIALAYFSIPAALVVIARRRKDLVIRPLLWLFAAFILLCGTTHWLDLATLWLPLYGLEALIKVATAVVSAFTAVALWRLLPSFLAFPSPQQLREANAALFASQEKLVQAQKMEAVGQLTGGVAHDFNNMLQVISGSTEMIDRRLKQGRLEDLHRLVNSIRQACENASRLTHQLLAFSRRQALQPKMVDPAKLVEEVGQLLRRTVGPETQLVLKVRHIDVQILIDPHQLESAILNLAINARDAMPTGGIMTIETANHTVSPSDPISQDLEAGEYLKIKISDTGSGISADIIDRVFEPFFTTKLEGKGTGLGLSQVYGFMRQSGGTAQIESKLGQGTSVRLYVPAHRQEKPVAERLDSRSEQPNELAILANRKIMLVDDEHTVRSQIADALRDAGCLVDEFGDGASALAHFHEDKRYDVLITDVRMPGMNGRQLAEAARAINSTLAIVFITGHAGKEVDALRDLADTNVFLKPFEFGMMMKRVAAILKDKHAA